MITLIGLGSTLNFAAGMAAIWEQIIPPNAVRLSSNNRVIEVPFSDEFLSSVDETTASSLSNQPERDSMNDAYTPQLEDYHSTSEMTPFGTIELAELLFAGNETTIFAIRDKPNWVIKDQANCNLQNGAIHPLLIDSLTLPGLIRFVSPPALLPFVVPLKLKYITMPIGDWYECMSRNGVARYAIMERMPIGRDEIHADKGFISPPLRSRDDQIIEEISTDSVSIIY
jgi:hypothetical protein